jgi:DNA-binding beta-propeller fold protein YncE
MRGEATRVIPTPSVKSISNGMALSRDGSLLLVSHSAPGGDAALHEFRVADGSRLRVVGRVAGGIDLPLRFHGPGQVWVASDEYVFVADHHNNRVQVLTPRLDFHGFVGVGKLDHPSGVCANDDVVVVSENALHRISVFSRGGGALVRRFGSFGSGDGQLHHLNGLCFLSGERHFAVAEFGNSRVSVFSVAGEFIRHVGVGKLKCPHGVASSAFDELVVADNGNSRVVVFSASGELLNTMGRGSFTGVAIYGGAVFAQDCSGEKCVIFGTLPQTTGESTRVAVGDELLVTWRGQSARSPVTAIAHRADAPAVSAWLCVAVARRAACNASVCVDVVTAGWRASCRCPYHRHA